MRDARGKPKARFQFHVQKWPVPESGGASLVNNHYLDTEPDGHQGGKEDNWGCIH